MRILIAHNAYQQKGGEDGVVASEMALLKSRGIEVELYSRHNDDINGMSRLVLVAETVWSGRTETDLARRVAEFRPDVIHAHNTFPLISPSLYFAAHTAGVPVVQTLHNFRLFCPQAMLLREGKVCEDCLGRSPLRGVLRGCYRGSRVQSAVIGGMQVVHRALGSYRNKVTRYIALNEFCRDKFIEGGLPAERIVVKPNFVDISAGAGEMRQGGLFVGRLSAEKGVGILMRAMDQVPSCQLNVIGSGPEESLLGSRANVRRLGFLPREQIFGHMQQAAYLLMPSIWYENFPLTLVEAFASGLPVIASRLGAMAVLVEDGKTGLLFDPGSAEDLARKIVWAEANPQAMREMGKQARLEYESKYTSEQNFVRLMEIYAEAIAARSFK
jgi:glycosyltransferase involved in cell wall biosynthesis